MKRALLSLAFAVGCATPIEVLKVASVEEAAGANGTKLHVVAIIRSPARAAMPPETTVEVAKGGAEAHVPRPGIFTYALDPDEKVVRDEQGRIIGVKSGERRTRFIAGTATLEGNEVHGELEDHVERVPLVAGDRVELRGTFAPGETVPTGGRVATTRAWSALIFGGVLLGGSWLPSIVVGATSGVDANHWLFVPIVGPFIAYATRDACPPSEDPTACFADAGTRIALIADGIFQSTGAILMLVGLPTTAEVRWGKDARLRIAPTFGRYAGLSLEGSF